MKKLYVSAAFAALSLSALAQTSAISACKTASGQVEILFDLALNCTNGPAGSAATLGGRTEIGFHSGANGWSVVREWDLPASTRGVRVAGEGATAVFKVVLPNPAAYYGLSTTPTTLNFVFNDGAQGSAGTANFPWYAEGKEQGSGTCNDFLVTVANLATCAVSNTQDLRAEVAVSTSPNPFSTSTVLSFDNPQGEVYTLKIMNLMGQEVRNYQGISTGFVEINRDELTSGVYFAVLSNAKGHFLTEKLVVQ